MPRAWRLVWAGLLAVGLAGSSAQGVHLRGQIERVGFVGSGRGENEQGNDHYRVGFYTPVYVQLTNEDGDTFTGSIEVRQNDRDGDEVVAHHDVPRLTGTANFYLYVPGSLDQNTSPFRVRVLDADGGLAKLYDSQNRLAMELMPSVPPTALEAEARVILDISKVNRLRTPADGSA